MRNLMKDIVTVLHEDGSKHENVRASVQKQQIFIDDVTIPLSIGDKIERALPSGQREVLLPHFPYQPCRAYRNQQQNYPM